MFENLNQQQKSIEWVEARFGCQKSVKSTDMVFDFKKFLQTFVNSIDPSFNKIDIEEACYRSLPTFGEAIVLCRSTEAAFEIEKMFHNVPVKDMFPGNYSCVSL